MMTVKLLRNKSLLQLLLCLLCLNNIVFHTLLVCVVDYYVCFLIIKFIIKVLLLFGTLLSENHLVLQLSLFLTLRLIFGLFYGFGVCPVTSDPTVVKVSCVINMPWPYIPLVLSTTYIRVKCYIRSSVTNIDSHNNNMMILS